MQRYFVRVTNGVVDQDLEFDGPDASAVPAPVGLIEVTGHAQWGGLGSLLYRPYNAQAQTFGARPAVRVIAIADFLDRWTMDELAALQSLVSGNARARAWWQQLTLRGAIDLDAARLVAGLGELKQAGVPALWPDGATADARIAAIRS